MKRMSKRALKVLALLMKTPATPWVATVCSGATRPEPPVVYFNANEMDKFERITKQWRSEYQATRRTLDALWKSGLVKKYALGEADGRSVGFSINEAGVERLKNYPEYWDTVPEKFQKNPNF